MSKVEAACVSVVMPVYNAEKFLEKAVNSALALSEVLEVILVEDGSEDDSYAVASRLSDEHDRVKLFTHESRQNKGAGLTRNLAIAKASGAYIAFLDADDEFLPNRFDISLPLLEADPTADGVYEVIGVNYYCDEAKAKHLQRMAASKEAVATKLIPVDYTGIEGNPAPEDLFLHLMKNDLGWISPIGLIIRRASLEGFELFNSNYLGQDSEFINRFALERRLIGTGSMEAVTLRGVHPGNRILKSKDSKPSNRINVGREYWFEYALNQGASSDVIRYLFLKITYADNKVERLLAIMTRLLKKPGILPRLL